MDAGPAAAPTMEVGLLVLTPLGGAVTWMQDHGFTRRLDQPMIATPVIR